MEKVLFGWLSFRRLPIAAVAAVALLLAACAAQPTTPAPADIPFGQGRVWQVEGKGIKPSYVFGTIHSTDRRVRELPAAVRTAFDAADAAAFELVDIGKAETEPAAAILLTEGRRLEEILGAELFQRTAAAVAPLGVPAVALQRLKPWALVGLLGVPPVELVRQVQGEPVLDAWMESEARRQGKAVHGLESLQEQIALFENLSDDDQIVMVTDLLNNYGGIQTQFDRLLQSYLDGNLAALMAEVDDLSRTSDVEATARFRNELIDERNRTMVERMLPLMAQDATFVAVGAAHLPGEAGILALLERQGFTVTRLH